MTQPPGFVDTDRSIYFEEYNPFLKFYGPSHLGHICSSLIKLLLESADRLVSCMYVCVYIYEHGKKRQIQVVRRTSRPLLDFSECLVQIF